MTMSITTLEHGTHDHHQDPDDPSTSQPLKSDSSDRKLSRPPNSRPRQKSRLIASRRRRRGVKSKDDDDDDDDDDGDDDDVQDQGEQDHQAQPHPHSSSSNSSSSSDIDSSTASSLVDPDSDSDDPDDDHDQRAEEGLDAHVDFQNRHQNHTLSKKLDQRNLRNGKQANGNHLDSDIDQDDLEAGVRRPPGSVLPSNRDSNRSDSELVGLQSTDSSSTRNQSLTTSPNDHDSSSFVPNKIAKFKSGQNPTDEPSSLSSPTTAPSQSHNTTIIFNQASWVTGLSAALAATTTSSHANSASADDQPVQTPRYIPYIEFENYSTYGHLIFDLNTGLSRRARVDCKPDGLEKAPPEALQDQFVRIHPSLDRPTANSSQQHLDPPSTTTASSSLASSSSSSPKHPRKKATFPGSQVKHQAVEDLNEKLGDHSAPDATNKFNGSGEKSKKKKKKKRKTKDPFTSSRTDGPSDEIHESSDQRLKIKVIPPQSSPPTKNSAPIEGLSTSASSHFHSNRPPSSLSGAGMTNRPSSAFSHAAQSEDNRSCSASEAHSLEPWAVPRSGRFWGHDDRSNYFPRRGGPRGFLQNRSPGGHSRGSLRNRGSFRADWPSSSSNHKRPLVNHTSTHRPETPAGQSDTGRSVGSGAGWITVPSKQKTFPAGSQHHQSHFNSHRHQSDQADSGEWRHDGWEEIEREADRRRHQPSIRGRTSYTTDHKSRGGAGGWRSGALASQPSQSITPNLTMTSSERPSHDPPPTHSIPSADIGLHDWTTKSLTLTSGQDRPKIVEPKVVRNSTSVTDPPGTKLSSRSEDGVDEDASPEGKKMEEIGSAPHPVSQTDQPSSPAHSTCPSNDASSIVVKLPKAIKIGTIPVYPPRTLKLPVVNGKNEPASKSQRALSNPTDHVEVSVRSMRPNSSTPELSENTPQVSHGSSTVEDLVSQESDPDLRSISQADQSVPGTITLGSIGGAEVLREAMSAPKHLLRTHPVHPNLVNLHSRGEHPVGVLNSLGHSRTSSVNSNVLTSVSFGHHHHPDFVESNLRHPPPPPNFTHQPTATSYHNPVTTQLPPPPPPPPTTAIHHPANFYQPPLPPIPPLQYFDAPNHNLVYPHPPSLGPPPQTATTSTNHVYGGGYLPPPPPPLSLPPSQLGPSRSYHPPMYHPLPLPPLPPSLAQQQRPAFESTSAPAVLPVSSSSSGMMLPGHFAPPKSTKVRISNPGGGKSRDETFCFSKPSTPAAPQIKTTENGINYYEYNGVTYFGDCLPPNCLPPPPSTNGGGGTHSSSIVGSEVGDSIRLNGSGGIGHEEMPSNHFFRAPTSHDDYHLEPTTHYHPSPPPPPPPYHHLNFLSSTSSASHHHHHHHHPCSSGFQDHEVVNGHLINGFQPHHSHHQSIPAVHESFSLNTIRRNPLAHRPDSNPSNVEQPSGSINGSTGVNGTGSMGGQVVLSQVIKPLGIPFG